MAKTIYLTESQVKYILDESIINESFKDLIYKVRKGIINVPLALAIIAGGEMLSKKQQEEMSLEVIEAAPVKEWKLLDEDFTVTVYNAVPSQCNNDVQHTASGFLLDLSQPEKHKIVAIERGLMQEFGLQYGDLIKVVGTYGEKQDDVYVIEDLMNKRFGDPNSKDYCPHKIDILVKSSLKYGGTNKGEFAKIYVLNDKSRDSFYRSKMLPEYKGI